VNRDARTAYQLNPTDPHVDPRGTVVEIVIPHDVELDLDEPLDVAILGLLTELHGQAGDGEPMPECRITTAGRVDVKVTHYPAPVPTVWLTRTERYARFGDMPEEILAAVRPDPSLAQWCASDEGIRAAAELGRHEFVWLRADPDRRG